VSETIFTKIIRKEIPARILYEDEHSLAFEDIHPQAPVHFLVIPKQPMASLLSAGEGDAALLGHLLMVVGRVARERGLEDDGFRVVTNIGRYGGQSVPHLHFHVLGGRALEWPPG
jgi:histidine triad (HIT) family protein